MHLAKLAVAEGSDLGFIDIVKDIPTDGPAIFIYALTLISIYLIWKGSRTRS